MTLRPLSHTVLFQFLDTTSGQEGRFSERTRSGLIIPTLQQTQKGERWGRVVAVGPDVEGISAGDFVLIEPLMWNVHGKFEGEKFWKTNADKILAVSNELADTVQF